MSKGELLHTGRRLKRALRLAKLPQWRARLGEGGTAYLEACRRVELWKTRMGLGVSAALLVVGVAGSWWFSEKTARRHIQDIARSVAQQVSAQLTSQHLTDERAALLAVQAYRINRTLGGDATHLVDSALRAVIDADSFANVLPGGAQACLAVDSIAILNRNRTVTVQRLDDLSQIIFNLPAEVGTDYLHLNP